MYFINISLQIEKNQLVENT